MYVVYLLGGYVYIWQFYLMFWVIMVHQWFDRKFHQTEFWQYASMFSIWNFWASIGLNPRVKVVSRSAEVEVRICNRGGRWWSEKSLTIYVCCTRSLALTMRSLSMPSFKQWLNLFHQICLPRLIGAESLLFWPRTSPRGPKSYFVMIQTKWFL